MSNAPMVETYHNNGVTKVCRFDTLKQAEKWITKNQSDYPEKLYVGTNIKDGYVAFYNRVAK